MAKVGILTQPLGSNYGGVLQAFALQKVLKDLGHEPITIDRRMNSALKLVWYARQLAKYPLGRTKRWRSWLTKENYNYIYQHTLSFIDKHIILSPEISSTKELKRYTDIEGLDAFIVGSDQVWRKEYSPHMPNYFLDFIPSDSPVKKIAYAASFGIDEWAFTKKETEYFSLLAQEFDVVSVREDSAVDLCCDYLGVEATHVLDPTLLIDQEVYRELAFDKNTSPSKGNLFCYILDRTPEKMQLVQDVADKYGLAPFELLPKKLFTEIKSDKELDDCILPPVEQWLRSIIEADFVITDSFHGTAFSILFNKPFIPIPNASRGLTRFTSLLRQFHLQYNATPSTYTPINPVLSETLLTQLRENSSHPFSYI